MKTPRELILARHQSAEAKLKAIRAEDLAACVRSAAQANLQRLPALDLTVASGSGSDREPSRLAAQGDALGHSGNQTIRELLRPLRAGTARGPESKRRRWVDLWSAVVRFWQDTFGPWRRAWIGIGVVWFGLLAFSLANSETPRTASTNPPRPDAEALAVLREQKELLAQLLGSGDLPLISRYQTPGPRSAADPPPRSNESTGRLETTQRPESCAQV